jgi:hypothetical protein
MCEQTIKVYAAYQGQHDDSLRPVEKWVERRVLSVSGNPVYQAESTVSEIWATTMYRGNSARLSMNVQNWSARKSQSLQANGAASGLALGAFCIQDDNAAFKKSIIDPSWSKGEVPNSEKSEEDNKRDPK